MNKGVYLTKNYKGEGARGINGQQNHKNIEETGKVQPLCDPVTGVVEVFFNISSSDVLVDLLLLCV